MSEVGEESYSFDVFTSPHDDVKMGQLCRVWSRVVVSASYPLPMAADLAACIAVARHGGMATSVLLRI